MSGNDKEIPEDLFRKEYGGDDFQRARDARRREQRTGLAANGLLFLLLGPAVLAAIAAAIGSIMYFNGNIRL